MAKNDVSMKIMLVGAQAVGKSCLINQFCHKTYTGKHYATVGVELDYKVLEYNGVSYKLQFLDTSGQPRFAAITENFMSSSDAFLIVYDVTRSETLDELEGWLSSVAAKAPGRPIVVVGNKSDLGAARQIERYDAEDKVKALCQKMNIPVIPLVETSAMIFETVDEAVKKLLTIKASKPTASSSAKSSNSSPPPKMEKTGSSFFSRLFGRK